MSKETIICKDLAELVKALDYPKIFNVTLLPSVTHPDLPAGEKGFLEKITPNGHKFIFSDSGFTFPGHGFIRYQDVSRATWPFDPDDQQEEYQKSLEIVFRDRPPITIFVADAGTSVALGGLITMMRVLTEKPAAPAPTVP